MNDNQKNLLSLAGTGVAQIISLIPGDAAEVEQLVIDAIKAKQIELNGAKATGIELANTLLEIAKGTGHEFGKPEVAKLVDDIAELGEDAIEQKYFQVFTDFIGQIIPDIKALTKKKK